GLAAGRRQDRAGERARARRRAGHAAYTPHRAGPAQRTHHGGDMAGAGTESATTVSPSGSTGNGTKAVRASDLAYERLRALIVGRERAPGGRVDEQTLAARVCLGRTPVHEALARLAGDQLVVVLPRRGLMIAPIGLDRVREIFEAREAIECGNAYFA